MHHEAFAFESLVSYTVTSLEFSFVRFVSEKRKIYYKSKVKFFINMTVTFLKILSKFVMQIKNFD